MTAAAFEFLNKVKATFALDCFETCTSHVTFVKEAKRKQFCSQIGHISILMILIWNIAKSFVIMHITRFIIQLTLIYTRSLSVDGLFGLFPGFEAFVDPRPQIGHLS